MFAYLQNATSHRGASKRHGLLNRLADAVDAYAAHRMQMAVPEFEQRRAEREITRYRRQMRRGA